MNHQERNYWLDTVTMPSGADGPLPESVDVAVIGAGFTGLSAARTFAKRGARVAVLEAETIGWGASSRNGGMVLTGLKVPVQDLVQRYGMEAARRMYGASLTSIDCVEQIVAQESIDCNFARCGYLQVAAKPAHFDRFQRAAEFMAREFNHQRRVVPQADLKTEIGSNRYFGGLVDELSATVNPARYIAGLAKAAQKAGAEIHERVRVAEIAESSREGARGFVLSTSRGSLFAHNVLVGTSGYTTAI
ncbi:MAG TPA: FAD-dependent oxidoreductase, partial [Terriglobales bacterium]